MITETPIFNSKLLIINILFETVAVNNLRKLEKTVSGLDSRIEELTDQLSKLQSLNRSLQAQNFTLSTTLSHKDVTFDKLKKYLNKGK